MTSEALARSMGAEVVTRKAWRIALRPHIVLAVVTAAGPRLLAVCWPSSQECLSATTQRISRTQNLPCSPLNNLIFTGVPMQLLSPSSRLSS